MPETTAVQEERTDIRGSLPRRAASQPSSTSLHELCLTIRLHQQAFAVIVGSLLVACLIYCLVAPNVYEATAGVALRGATVSVLAPDHNEAGTSGSFASGQVQLETLANMFRSDQLAWVVITRLKLYAIPGFTRSFERRFPSFNANQPDPQGRAFLLDEFQRNLTVQTIPRTLVLQIRFRSHDAALSAAVVNTLIEAFRQQDEDARMQATKDATAWLNAQLVEFKTRANGDDRKLADFQKRHGLLNTPQMLGNGPPTEVEHTAELSEVDALSRELITATTDRIVLEAEYRSAVSGDPDLVLASDSRLRTTGSSTAALLQQLRTRRSDLQQEQAQLRIEHGPNFPRVVEIRSQMEDLDSQIRAEDAKLVERFRSAWKTASEREQLVRKSLSDATVAGMKQNEAASQYAVMRQEANANHDVYVRVSQQVEEAGLAAGSRSSEISVIDYARQPVKPYSPDMLVDMAVTLFVSLWLALAAVRLRESLRTKTAKVVALMLLAAITAGVGRGQAPTPSTSGLPTGVARIPQSTETRSQPNVKDAPSTWGYQEPAHTGVASGALTPSAVPMAALIAPGDMLEVSETHSPDMRASVRVSEAGTVTLTLAGNVQVSGMGEADAAHAIETALIDRGMLLHPQVNVLVTVYAGQDVSILGEVARPGVYMYTVHHCLLDLISTASGLSANAGRLVIIVHRNDPKTARSVLLDPTGADTTSDHNPELLPGDTVQVSRAGLVYVVGDVIRPGGFPVDPVETPTVLQALSLAWGPTQNAAQTKALLIREQQGSRTITNLNLKRMLHGLDPDVPIRDRDILFVPDSMAKNLFNRTIESAIQSAVGVSIYAGLVYSQRF